ncbi:ATP-binding protein [Pseudobutyrivibrio sp.]|uniref:ATP-binding protein n=1 Tax=Pseudobutyrivibrio sp. TaxID=2014367 RepID=UPI001DC9E69C|nr:ATP-binding protein [Pseudobutyrivibrio sp.]MBE5910964.1 hypothetical protein [Pseudobutyrivibrio sp.]
MSRTFTANTENSNLWAGLGTQYTSISQVINEFVDNSISNFKGHPSLNTNSIIITLEELDTSDVKISIEDSGTGISDFSNAFGIGAKSRQDSPLNEHGFGMKQAFAAADPQNSSWRLCTRTDASSATYDEVSAPYTFNKDMIIDDSKTDWPGEFSSTGTYIEFTCSHALFKTVSRGIKGDQSRFIKLAALLYEDLGFTYAGIIKTLSISMKLKVKEKGKSFASYNLSALVPSQKSVYPPGISSETVSFDEDSNSYIPDRNGKLTINYQFLEVESKDTPKNDSELFDNTKSCKYYKANMSTSGIEIRFNGRVMKYNIFDDVWATEKHNSYNSLLVIIDLQTDDASLLPGTTTSKNGLNEGDEKIEALYGWIKKKMPNPIKSMSKSTSEIELFNKLKEDKERAFLHSSSKPTVSVEQRVWHAISTDEKKLPRIDLYECTISGDVNIYEGKYNKTDSQDVYQLKMYWDGLINDGTTPTCGILVADEHPEWVIKLVSEINKQLDSNGNNYNFVTDTWKNLGVKS